jgi:sterol desaturase/sphingolipid hydroxylase (fatty acid hydroxylase superfamily)
MKSENKYINYSISSLGYHLPYFMSNEMHDFHHLKFNQNYGTNIGFFDWLHGTNKMWKERGTFARHRVLWGTKSARELYPCETDK